MIKRKWLVLLLSVVLIFVAACSGSGGNNKSTNDSSSPVVEQTPVPSSEPEPTATVEEEPSNPNATPEMDFDMGGKVIKLVSWYDEILKDDNPDNILKLEKLNALMEKHNFSIEMVIIEYGEYQEKVTTSLLAGEPVGDIIRLPRPWMIPSLVQQDLFWPLDDYVKNDQVFLQQYTKEHAAFDGKGYGFRLGIMGAASGIFYNRTLLNSLGMTDLQTYVDNDTWNFDKFIEVAKEANKDTNNDSKLDTWGLASSSFLVNALAANEAYLVNRDKQALDDPKTMEVFNFISQIGVEQIARPTEGGDWTEPKQFFIQGNTLMYSGADYEKADFTRDMPDIDVGFLPFPKGPSASAYHSSNPIPNYYTIPKAIENPEQLVYIWEKFNDIESMYDYPKQAQLESLFTNESDINNARVASDSIRIVEGINSYPSMPFYDLQNDLSNGTSVSTIIEKYKAPFQAAVDEIWIQ